MTTLLLTALATQQTDNRIFPPFRSTASYELKVMPQKHNLSNYAVRVSDGARFGTEVFVHNDINGKTVDYVANKRRNIAEVHLEDVSTSPSRLPAKYLYFVKSNSSSVGAMWNAIFADDHVAAEVWLTAPMDTEVRTVGSVTGVVTNRIRKTDMTYAVPVLEQLGRFSLSAYLGNIARPAQATPFAGTSLTTKVSAFSDTRFVRLESAAKAAGWKMTKGEHNITAQLTKPGRPTLIFVAAADSYKVGSTWQDLPDVPLVCDDELWVPTTALQTLAG